MIRYHDVATPALLCHKEPARRIQREVFCLLLAGSLWHKGAYNRNFPCMEATYPICHKEPARSWRSTIMKIFQFYKALDQWEPRLEPPDQWECSTLLNIIIPVPLLPEDVVYQGRVSESGGRVVVYPEIKAKNGPICGFRIVNTDWGNIPFEVRLQ